MNKKIIITGAAAIIAVTAIAVNFAINASNQPPEPLQQTQQPQQAPSLIGTKAHSYSLPNLDGTHEDSEQWSGKVQVINFWATWCSPCKREIPVLIELQNQYQDQGLQIIGIALDNAEMVQKYAAKAGINYPILADEDEAITIAEKLGNNMGVLPYTVVVDRSGNISYTHYGEIKRESIEKEIKPLL